VQVVLVVEEALLLPLPVEVEAVPSVEEVLLSWALEVKEQQQELAEELLLFSYQEYLLWMEVSKEAEAAILSSDAAETLAEEEKMVVVVLVQEATLWIVAVVQVKAVFLEFS
jgi:hypothetical protein